jgi:hypothetical protein
MKFDFEMRLPLACSYQGTPLRACGKSVRSLLQVSGHAFTGCEKNLAIARDMIRLLLVTILPVSGHAFRHAVTVA